MRPATQGEMGKLFGTDGIRGKFGQYPITEDFAHRLGWALVRLFGKETEAAYCCDWARYTRIWPVA